MKNKSLFGSILGFCLIALIPITAFISCEVGLGEAVDVAAPVISIETPETSAIIRDTFAIAGNWSDDGSIKDLDVVLRNTGTNKEYDGFKPVLTLETDAKDPKGTWSATIDPVTAKIPDGNYEATITISDNGHHTTEITRTFIIDNTAPVMVLSRPSSSKTDSDNLVESYGQYLTLEGQAADDNDIEEIVINFYSKDAPETLLWTKRITSIPPTISLDVAKFLDKDVYTKIYGDEKAGEKYYYCTITAYDSAKRYPLEGQELEGDDLGNAESSYILWSDWEKFQSEYQKITGGSTKLKVPDLYAIKAGKSGNGSRTATQTSLIEALFEKSIPCGSFKLNPENSPTFSISGLELGSTTDVENERALTVQLAKGLDGLSLMTDDMKVYLIPVSTDANGNEVLGKKVYPQTSEFQKKGDGQFLTKIIKEDNKDENGQAVSLEYGKVYIIGVDGKDSEENKIVPSFDGSQYYIKFKAKNVAPGLTITTPSPATTYLKKGQSLTFSGSTSVPDGYPTITITCKKGEETTATTVYSYKVTEADKDKYEGGLIFYNFDFTVPIDGTGYKFDQTSSNQYIFDITADLEDMPTTRTKTVIYDIDGPTISIDSMLPTAEKFKLDADGDINEEGEKVTGEFLNGDVTMKIAILDDYDAVQTMLEAGKEDRRPYFIIEDAQTGEEIPFRAGNESQKTTKHLITTPAKQSFVIHTKDIADGEQSRKIKVKIFAQDRAGNLGVDIDDTENTAFERVYTVDQTTDIPVIIPYNAASLTLKYSTVAQVEAALAKKEYKSILTTGSDLLLSVKDDDGIQFTKFFLSEKNTALPSNATPTESQELQDIPSDYNFRYTLPTISGRYECKIIIEDKVGNKNTKDFWIIVTGAAPQVSISSTTPDNKTITLATGEDKIEAGAKTQFTNVVEIESGYTSFKVSRFETVLQNGVAKEKETVLYGSTENNWLNAHSFTDTFIPAATRTTNKIRYVVADEMGKTGEREFVYYIDSQKPTISADSIIVPTNRQTESSSFKFEAATEDVSEGDINDGYKASGVSKIQYTFDSSQAQAKIKEVRGVTSLNEKIEFADSDFAYVFGSEGAKTIYIRAIDDVGNIGDWVSKGFMYDTKEPALNIVSYKRGSEASVNFATNVATKAFDSGDKFSLSGTVSDNTGIQTFEIWQDDVKLNLPDNFISNGTWTITELPRDPADPATTLVETGTFVYTVKATDNSNFGTQTAKTTTAEVTVTIDKTSPTVSIALEKNDTSDSDAYGENSLKGNAYTFRGEATDVGSGFDKLYYAFTTVESAPASYSQFVSPSTNSWSIPMNLATGTGTDSSDTLHEGKRYLYVRGVDKAGNWTEPKHVAFMIDQAAPVIANCKIYKDGTTETAAASDGIVYLNAATGATGYTLKGTVSDANGISKLTVDGTEVTVTDGNWEKPFTAQGNFTHTIIAYDNSGKTADTSKSTTITSAVMFDTTAPEATVTDFDETATAKVKWLNGTGDTYINGTASDEGAGLDKLEIKVDSGDYKTIPLSTNWSYKYTITDTFAENDDTDDSRHTVTVKATDKAKNSEEYTYYFRYDKTAPTASLSLNRNGEFVKKADLSAVKLSGYAYDNQTTGRAVKSAKITVKKDGTVVTANEINLSSSLGTTAGDTFGTFSKTGLADSSYGDGLYVFTLEVKDKADNSPAAGSTLTASMTVDKTVPVINKVRFGELSSSVTSLSSNSSKSKISVQFTEKNPEAVYYYINDGSNSSLTGSNDAAKAKQVAEGDWINMKYTASGTAYNASKDASFNDGNGKVYIKVVDKAGNVTYDTTLSYEVDTKAPDVCTLATVDGAALNGSKLINGENDVVFTVNATDYNDNRNASGNVIGNDATRVNSVKLTKIGNDTYTGNAIVSGTATTSNGAKTGIWTITIPSSKFSGKTSGSFPVTVTVEDTKGNKKDFQLFTLDIDQIKPTLNSYALAYSYDAGASNGQTFFMNNVNNEFTLTGIAKDDREIEEVTLTIKDSSGTTLKTLTSSDSAWTFTSENTAEEGEPSNEWTSVWAGWTNYVTVELSVRDKAQNEVEVPETFKIIFDTTPPNALHKTDDSGKDIYFRVGDQDRDDGCSVSNGTTTWTPAWSDKLDKDVGGKYTSGTYGNKETIKIRGNFSDVGSGVAMIYYQLYTTVPSSSQINSFVANPAGKATGYFSPKGVSETLRRIFYTGTIDGLTRDGYITITNPDNTQSTKNYIKLASTYLTTLSGFKEGHNYLVLVAVDNVGNAAVDNITGNYYTINVDTKAPETSAMTEDVYTDAESDLKLAFTVADNPSGENAVQAGVKSVKVKMNGVADEFDAKLNTTSGKYEVTIPKNKLPTVSNTYSVSVTAVDKAGTGNSDTRTVGSVIVDKTPPSVRVTSNAGFVTNSIENASIYVYDTNGLKKNDSGKEIVTYNLYLSTDVNYATSLANGTIEVNTTKSEAYINSDNKINLSLFQDGNSYIIRFTAEDIVGNKSYVNTEKYTIDRTPPNIDNTNSGVGGTKTVAAVSASNKWFNEKTLIIKGKYTDKAGSLTGSGVVRIHYNLAKAVGGAAAGSWETTNGSYETSLAGFEDGTNTLKLRAEDAMGNIGSYTTYTVKVDTKPPTISSNYPGVIYADAASCPVELTVTDDTGASGVASVTLTVGDKDPVDCGDPVNGKYTKDIISLLEGGTVSVTATATDNAGNTASRVIANVMLDIDGPELVINTPAANAKTSKSITVSGSASDGTGSGIDITEGISLYYTKTATVGTVTPTKDTISSWTKYTGTQPTLSGQTWTGTFDATAVATNGNNTTLYICAGAVDTSGSGNQGYSAPVKVIVDRKVPVSSTLTIDEVAGSDLGSDTTTWFKNTTLSMSGTFTDSGGSGVTSVKYQVKKAGDSSYASAQTIASNGSYTANVTGLAAGTNTIKVWAVDAANNASTAVEYTVKVDDKAPTISAEYPGVIYADSASCPVVLTVTDQGGSTIDKVTLTVGDHDPVDCGDPVDSVNGIYTLDIKDLLSDGTVSVTATAKDKAGNETSRVIANVMKDTTGPDLAINSPGENAKTNNSITVSGSASDGTGSGINNAADKGITLYYTTSSSVKANAPTSATIGTTPASKWVAYTTKPTLIGQSFVGTFNVPDAVAANGSNTTLYICVGAVDKSGSGNPGYSDPVKIVVDRKVPVSSSLTIDEVEGDSVSSTWFNNTTVSLHGTFTDTDGSGVASVKYAVKKAGASDYAADQTIASDGEYTANVKGLAAGTNTIKVWAVDTVGNILTPVEYTVKVDATAPTISSSYTGVIYASSSSCPVNLTVTDTGSSGLKSVKVTIGDYTGNCTNTSGSAYTIDLQGHIPEGTSSVTAVATDNAGNETSRVIANVMKDETPPDVVINTPSANDKTSATISLSGSISDGVGSGIKESEGITLYYTKTASVGTVTPTASTISSWTAYGTKMTLDGQTWSGSFTVPTSVAADDANTTLYLSVGAVDNAGTGNKGYSTPVKVVVDKAKPAKSLFKVGTTVESAVSSTWFNNETLNINGTFTDDGGSGVSAILYKLDSGTEQEIPTTDGTFNTNIAGFSTGNHTLVVRAKDKVNNYSGSTSYTIKVDMSQPEISEVTANDFKKITLSNGTIAKTFEFYVTDTGSGVATAASSVTVKAGSHAIANGTNGSSIAVAAVSGQTNKWKATVTLGAADLATLSGNNSVIVTVSDQAGNTSNSQSIGTLNMDTDKPVPSFTSHQASAKVNKTITLGGKVTDPSNSAIKSIALTATSGTGTNAVTKQFAYPAASGKGTITYANGQWSAELDTTQLYNGVAANGQAMSLSITATDEADNTSTAVTQSLTIDQNSDRPVVKFTNIVREGTGANAKYILKYGNNAALEGTLTDDDATSTDVVKVFKASSSAITSATAATTGTTTFNAATGDFTFTPESAADGEKQVYFYIKDNNDNEFYTTYTTGTNPSLKRPYQQYKTETKADNNAVLKYNSDSEAPVINSVQLQAYTAATDNMETQIIQGESQEVDTTKNGVLTSLGTNCIVGGTSKNYVDLTVSAKDANGVKGIVIKVQQGTTITYYRSNNTVSETGVTSYANSGTVNATTNASSNHVYTTSRINITDYVNGEVTVTVKVYDNSGLYNNQESKFVIDRSAPTLSIDNNVAEGSVVYGINKITIGGSATATDVEKIYYTVTESVADWEKSKEYAVNDLVFINDKYYKCKTAHTSEDDFVETNWNSYIPDWNWVEVEGQKISASIIFGGSDSDAANGKISDSLRKWIQTVYNYDDTYMTEHDENKLLSIHFKAVDACGNAGYSKRTLSVVPNGDKPVITLSYPVDKSANVHPSLAGTIRIYGNAEVITGSVSAVYVQIDTNYDGTFDESWKSGFDTCIAGKNTSYEIGTFGNPSMQGIKATGTLNWNLPINSNKEFNPIAGSQPETRRVAIRIYGVGGSGKVSEPVIQEFTIDPNAPHIGGTGEHTGVMQLKLVQFDSENSLTAAMTYSQAQAAIANQMAYIPGQTVWVQGQWYIAASVYDDSGIGSIKLDENISGIDPIYLVKNTASGENGTIQSNLQITTSQTVKTIFVKANDCKAAINNVAGKNNFDVYIPLPTSTGSGSLEFTIEAVEASEHNNGSTETVKVNFDNTPPRLGTVGHENYNPNAYNVKQDNGFYRIFGYATDTESGNIVSDMKAVAFYFVRRGTANTRVYDPMYKDKYEKDASNNDKRNYVVIQTGTSNTTGITYEYGMFWNTKTVGRSSTNLSELTLTTKDDNIHAGGFVLIGGTIYTIRSVSADGKTITLKTEAPAGITTAKFAYAMVIDNFDMTESIDTRTKIDSSAYGYGYYGPDSTADDGDLMQEKWASGKWEAWINSNNIPDGPIEIHYVALDNAQNYSVGIVGNLSLAEYQAKTTLDVSKNGTPATASNGLISGFDYIYDANKKAYVSNNAPRIAGVTVGTDYNGNGTVEANEKQTKYVAQKTVQFGGVYTDVAGDITSLFIASGDNSSDGASMMAIKGAASVEAEIIGGNGNIYYQYSIDGATYKDHATIAAIDEGEDGAFVQNTTAMSITREANEGLANDADYQATYYKATRLPAITFTEAEIKSAVTANTEKTWFTFEFWDSTEETTAFSNSQYAQLKLPVSIQVYDNTVPNTVISPLYWKSASDNSVYQNVNGELFGHVELIKDLTYNEGDTTKTTALGTTYDTTDDKVSGIVVFRGFAYDNRRLAKLEWAIVDSSNHSVLPNNANGISYNAGSTFSNTGWSTGGTLAYNANTKEITGTYKFTVKTAAEDGAYLDSKGHKVAWELAVDTSQINGVVASNAKVYVRATDAAGKVTVMTGTGATGSPAAGVTDQEAIDKATKKPTYPVDILPYITSITTRMSKKDTTNPEVYSRTARGHYPIASDETATGSVVLHGYNLAASNADVDISAGMGSRASGAYAYTVSGTITTINNMNYNDAHGDYNLTTEGLAEKTKVANMYNRQPNTSTNLNLTDDVYFDMWELNNGAATSGSALRYPVMHINPTNNQIGFGFVRGSDSVSFPANGNSYLWYQKNRKDYIGTNFVYDSNGIAHNVSIGLDAQFDTGIAGRMLYNNSNWYAGNNGPNRTKQWDMRYSISLESIGIPNGVFVKGVQTNVSGGMGIIDIDRFSTPAIAASAHDSGTAVYIMYYDSDHDQIRFRYGEVPKTGANRTGTQYGLLNDSKCEIYRHNTNNNRTDIPSDTSNDNDTWNAHGMFEASKSYYALVTGKYYNQTNDELNGTAGTLRTDTGNNGSAYYALGVIPGNSMNNDKVVMVWFDQVADKLMYMYRMNLGTNANASNRDASVNGVDDVWSKPEVLYSGPLQDCAMTVDINDGIHIVAYDQNNANLLYMYKQSYNTTGVYSCVVDSYSQIGNRLSIDTALNADNKVVPYISYFAEGLSSLPKLAYLPNGITTTSATTIAASIKDGADASTNLFTGDWEVTMIPTSSKLQTGAGYNVSIGVFKDKTAGSVGQAFKPEKGTDSMSNDKNTCSRYANGTSELVLGYGIKNNGVGYIETAMRK